MTGCWEMFAFGPDVPCIMKIMKIIMKWTIL